jgi:hypothetical protein
MSNNDDKFLGRPVQFNAVGRIAEGTTDKENRPVKMSNAQTTRLIVGVLVLIILAGAVWYASTVSFGVSHTPGRGGELGSKPTPGANF